MQPINITHDGTLDIATGRSRKETSWKNKEVLWSDLVKKLSETHRTAETLAEYNSSNKPRQDEIKDVGGFVGGYLAGGKRKAGSVMHRQLITLDLDFAKKGVWEDFLFLYDSASVMYSTHKHTPEHPRLRLVIPLDRPVACDEYSAIARRIAGYLGIEQFDNTGFEPSRLMYWPSTSKDGEYSFTYQDGPWLCADDVLKSYHNWKDSSEWPISERYTAAIHAHMKKQGDPLEKPGVVGAFCRAFSIHEAIDMFLGELYKPCDIEGRYTYVHGSTSGGLVTYDDKFAYSHHGTDPISGTLRNAFDLVRIHLFGLKDEDAKEGTPGNKMPSYTEMIGFATKEPKVRQLIVSEKMQSASIDFANVELDGEEEVDDSWKEQLKTDRKGNVYNGINNIVLLLEKDPLLRGRIVFDEFEQREIMVKRLHWRSKENNARHLLDSDVANLKHYLKSVYDITVTTTTLEDALKVLYERCRINSVKDYLKPLKWDGTPRVDSLLIEYLGAPDNDYVKAVTRKMLVAAVSRVFDPGIKFDNMLVLVGKQGIGKSTIIRKLGQRWFSDSFNFHMLQKGKEGFEQLQGAWIIEVGELAGLSKADEESAKGFLSKCVDRYRVSYGRRVDDFPRQCIFFGSTNIQAFLRDQSGNRRFWPVETMVHPATKDVFKEFSQYEIDQVWAEAVELYRRREPLYLEKEIIAIAEDVQSSHTLVDDREGLIRAYLDMPLPENWNTLSVYERRAYLQNDDPLKAVGTTLRNKVCAAEIWCEVLGGMQKEMTSQNTKFIHTIMSNMPGWVRAAGIRKFGIYDRQRGYERISKAVNATGERNGFSDEKVNAT